MGLIRRALELVAPPFCWSCGAEAPSHDPLCRGCRGELHWLGHETRAVGGVEVWAPLAYEGAARALVKALKYRGEPWLARPMAAQIAANAPPRLFAGFPALVPVPAHPDRARRRGYDQAHRLADELRMRVDASLALCLRRTGGAGRQVGRTRAQRLAALEGTIEMIGPGSVPESVVIVDDVVTTGATIAATAAVLRERGALDIRATAYARTPGR